MRRFSDWIERTLKRVKSSRVTFADGSYLEYLNREALLYKDVSGRRMEIIWFFDERKIRGRVLRLADINHWDSPDEGEQIKFEKKSEIERKVQEYCRAMRIPVRVIEE